MNLRSVYQGQRQEIVKKPIVGHTRDAKPVISLLAALRQRMAPAALARAWQEGRALSVAEALAAGR
jgi:hypothetical protein